MIMFHNFWLNTRAFQKIRSIFPKCWTTPAIGNLEIWDLVHIKTDIDMFIYNIEHFLRDIRAPRYLHLKKLYFFAGHPVWEPQKSKMAAKGPQNGQQGLEGCIPSLLLEKVVMENGRKEKRIVKIAVHKHCCQSATWTRPTATPKLVPLKLSWFVQFIQSK